MSVLYVFIDAASGAVTRREQLRVEEGWRFDIDEERTPNAAAFKVVVKGKRDTRGTRDPMRYRGQNKPCSIVKFKHREKARYYRRALVAGP